MRTTAMGPTAATSAVHEGARFAGPPRGTTGRRRWVGPFALALALGLLAGRFALAGTGDSPAAAGRPRAAAPADPASTVADLQARLRVTPDSGPLLTQLGVAYLGRARETADPTFYAKAAGALDRARALAPNAAPTLVGAGLLALGRHDFTGALDLGRHAHEV